MNHFIELEEKGMINRSSSVGLVSITSKGRKFIKQYDELINLIETAAYRDKDLAALVEMYSVPTK